MILKFASILLLTSAAALAQSTAMTNADIIEMSHAGLSPTVIEAKIASSSCRFDTSTAGLSRLKSEGVSDAVVASMFRCSPAKAAHAKPYVWIGANEEWTTRSVGAGYGNRIGNRGAVVTGVSRGTTEEHSEFADVARELSSRCPGVQITNSVSDADYAVSVDRHNAGHLLTQRNDYNIFRAGDGQLIQSGKTTHLKNAVSDICRAIPQGSEGR